MMIIRILATIATEITVLCLGTSALHICEKERDRRLALLSFSNSSVPELCAFIVFIAMVAIWYY